jgi:hypothetical protein
VLAVSWSRTLVPEHESSSSTIDATGAVVSGDSYARPHLSGQSTDPSGGGSPTLVAWVQVEGSDDVRLGAGTAGIDRARRMVVDLWDRIDGGPQPSWGVELWDRYVFRRGECVWNGREAGPDSFPVPCVLRVAVDSSAGTLSFAIAGGNDLGVVVDQLPTDEPLHLAVGTAKPRCMVTLLDGEPTGGFKREHTRHRHRHRHNTSTHTRTHTHKQTQSHMHTLPQRRRLES